ncbi:hypothetical protein MZD04_gp356 [Pseudomonas phage Psa21]|uniref:Uncharacterized protein n=1 Tax=Pseudomonas phage Psa21 TaxID=2530023 RepID=A0A481W599_9CAUD|nr:hypothetical protein MZD04_gp356 [Pseudomonas phage Psa21]QBJ02882.1 hypothetical protein PSA21_356 [Pseudomonas phage Psa21]
MNWVITRYNGEVWEAPYQMLLTEALVRFMKDTGCSEWDIKQIVNTH